MAAFVNTVYILSKCLFSFLETIHHMIERWEIDFYGENANVRKHSDPVLEEVRKFHEEPHHQTQTKLYLSIFALLRFVIVFVYLI